MKIAALPPRPGARRFLVLVVALALAVAGCAPAQNIRDQSAPIPPPGDIASAPEPAPVPASPDRAADFRLTLYGGQDVLGDREVQFSSILGQGKPVVLNFWAGACPPCRKEMPDLQQVYDANRDRVLLLGIDGGPFLGLGTASDAETLIGEMEITYPTGTTEDARIIRDYGVVGMPTTYFIKPNGEVVGRKLGLLTREKLAALVEDLIEKSTSP